MSDPFEKLCALVDEFWRQYELPVKPGSNGKFGDDYYLKIYFFGILSRCPEKGRYLERALQAYPHVFRKRAIPPVKTQYRRLGEIEPFAREFWCWLQRGLKFSESYEDVLIDATTVETVLFARVGEKTKKNSPTAALAKR